MIIEDLVLSRADDLTRAQLVDSLKASAASARSIAGRGQERRRKEALERAARLDRVIEFLENESSARDARDHALCEKVREKLKARREW